jgi:hypothetical protein
MFLGDSSSARADLGTALVVKSSDVRGVFAIKVSGCVPERFFFARRFCPPQVVKGGAVLRVNKKHPPPTRVGASKRQVLDLLRKTISFR